MADPRKYAARAASTTVPGRVMCSARSHHFVADGPEWNGFPGEAVTPGELFLAGIASCGVELMQMLATRESIPLAGVRVSVDAELRPGERVHPDRTVFNTVRVAVELDGVTQEQGELLVKGFTGR